MAVFLTVPENTMRRMTDAPKVSPTEHAGLLPTTHAPLSAISRIVHYLLGIVPVDSIGALALSVVLSFPNCLLKTPVSSPLQMSHQQGPWANDKHRATWITVSYSRI